MNSVEMIVIVRLRLSNLAFNYSGFICRLKWLFSWLVYSCYPIIDTPYVQRSVSKSVNYREIFCKNLESSLNLKSFSGLRKRSSDGKELQWQIDNDMVDEVVQKYPMYKTKYYTVAFCDAASILLKITEEKYGLPKNHLIAVSNKY